jgi:hypothetical protein
MNGARAAWIPFWLLAVLWFGLGVAYQVDSDWGLFVVVIIVVVAGSFLTNLSYRWLQAAHQRRIDAKMEESRIPRKSLIDALINLSPQEVALLTARKTQELARDLAISGTGLPVRRLEDHRDLLGAVRSYVREKSDNRKLWPNPETPTSLQETVDETERIVGELQERTAASQSSEPIPPREVELYAGRLTAQSGAFQQLAGAA